MSHIQNDQFWEHIYENNLLPQYLTISQTAKRLKVHPKTLRRWEDKGILIPLRTTGNHRRYTLAMIEEIKNKRTKRWGVVYKAK